MTIARAMWLLRKHKISHLGVVIAFLLLSWFQEHISKMVNPCAHQLNALTTDFGNAFMHIHHGGKTTQFSMHGMLHACSILPSACVLFLLSSCMMSLLILGVSGNILLY